MMLLINGLSLFVESGERKILFDTGHCTGETNFRMLNEMLGNNIRTMHAGFKKDNPE